MKMGQAPAKDDIKHMKHICAKQYSSEGLLIDVCELSTVTKFSSHSKEGAVLEFGTLASENLQRLCFSSGCVLGVGFVSQLKPVLFL